MFNVEHEDQGPTTNTFMLNSAMHVSLVKCLLADTSEGMSLVFSVKLLY